MRVYCYLLLLLFYTPWAVAESLSVAVASNFTATMQQLAKRFEADTGYRLKSSYGSTGKLYAQIINGAPYQIFLAADKVRPQRLQSIGNMTVGQPFTYAIGQLLLWAPKASSVQQAQQQLRQGDFNFLAIANPKTAPYGVAAMEVLANMGLDGRYRKKTVKGENIAQTFQFVYSGNAQLGFIANAQRQSTTTPLPGVIWQIPQHHYQAIEQQAILLKRGEQSAAAQAFMQFLQSDEARQLIVASGYGVVDNVPTNQ